MWLFNLKLYLKYLLKLANKHKIVLRGCYTRKCCICFTNIRYNKFAFNRIYYIVNFNNGTNQFIIKFKGKNIIFYNFIH